jgi:hypothetical protein
LAITSSCCFICLSCSVRGLTKSINGHGDPRRNKERLSEKVFSLKNKKLLEKFDRVSGFPQKISKTSGKLSAGLLLSNKKQEQIPLRITW